MTTFEIEWQVVAAVVGIILALITLSIIFAKLLIMANKYKEQHEKMWEWFPTVLKKILNESVELEIMSGALTKNSPIETTKFADNIIPDNAQSLLKGFAAEECCDRDFFNLAHDVKVFLRNEWGEENISYHSEVNKMQEIAFLLYCTAYVNKIVQGKIHLV